MNRSDPRGAIGLSTAVPWVQMLPWIMAVAAALCAHLAAVILLFGGLEGYSHRPALPSYLEVSLLVANPQPKASEAPAVAEYQPAAKPVLSAEASAAGSSASAVLPDDLSPQDVATGSQESEMVIAQATEPVAAAADGGGDIDEQQLAELLDRVTASMAQSIRSAWKIPYSAPAGTRARVSLRLDRNGHIADMRFIHSTGIESFNTSIIRALRRLGGFPEVGLLPEAVYLSQFRELELVFDAESRRRL